jgi:hypothetical protein
MIDLQPVSTVVLAIIIFSRPMLSPKKEDRQTADGAATIPRETKYQAIV